MRYLFLDIILSDSPRYHVLDDVIKLNWFTGAVLLKFIDCNIERIFKLRKRKI